jgi:hypothetical protein
MFPCYEDPANLRIQLTSTSPPSTSRNNPKIPDLFPSRRALPRTRVKGFTIVAGIGPMTRGVQHIVELSYNSSRDGPAHTRGRRIVALAYSACRSPGPTYTRAPQLRNSSVSTVDASILIVDRHRGSEPASSRQRRGAASCAYPSFIGNDSSRQ